MGTGPDSNLSSPKVDPESLPFAMGAGLDSDLCSSRVNLESLLIRISCKVLSRWHGRGPSPHGRGGDCWPMVPSGSWRGAVAQVGCLGGSVSEDRSGWWCTQMLGEGKSVMLCLSVRGWAPLAQGGVSFSGAQGGGFGGGGGTERQPAGRPGSRLLLFLLDRDALLAGGQHLVEGVHADGSLDGFDPLVLLLLRGG